MGVANEEIARAVAEGVREADQRLILVGLAGSVWLNVGQQLGLKVASEVFADRALNPNGTLVPRSQPGAVIKDPEKVIAASLKMVTEGKTTAVNGQEITIRADTICLHSDTPGVVALARGLRERMEAAGVTVTPMSNFL